MVKISQRDWNIILEYSTQDWVEWMYDEFSINDTDYTRDILWGLFSISKDILIEEESDENVARFIIGKIQNNWYYQIDKKVLKIPHDLFISSDVFIDKKLFICWKVSIFGKLQSLVDEPIFIGGSNENSIDEVSFRKIISSFPTSTEIQHYYDARITDALKNFIESTKDKRESLEKYLSQKNVTINYEIDITQFRKYELIKYELLLEQLKDMLMRVDSISEKEWQKKIVEFILILYPKYIQKIEELWVTDYFNGKKRRIDISLITFDGFIDVIEIKKPVWYTLLNTTLYRENWTPSRTLSGTIMQIEKYLFHLSKWWKILEEKITLQHQKKIPHWLTLKITNPKWMIIAGRQVNNIQINDFELIKRKYANVVDIITYDDLIRRLENIIAQLQIS